MKICKIVGCLAVCVAMLSMNVVEAHATSFPCVRDNVKLDNTNLRFETLLPKPITEVKTLNGIARFIYGAGNSLKEMKYADKDTIYSEVDGKIMSAKSDDYEYTLQYGFVDDGERYIGINYKGTFFEFVYKDGNVESIKHNGTTVCRYEYNESAIPNIVNTMGDYSEIGLINPIRYQGWYWNEAVSLYYLGRGIFYNAEKNEFIQNDFSIDKYAYTLDRGEYSINEFLDSDIENLYIQMMNDRYYGIDLSAKNGAGWYSSRPVVEVIARCIYAENNYPDRKDDRIAISAVILNSMVSNNRTGYQEVTLQGRYATINDGGKGSNEAVSGKNKSDPVWQQATLLACIVYYGRSRNDITYFYSIPKGISTQEYFRAFSSITLTYNNGARLNGATRSNVAIAGYGTINNQNDVRTVNNYDKSRYNIFYNY